MKEHQHIITLFYTFECFQAEELKDTMGQDFVTWVAQYLVMKRASIEPNFHNLYSNFVDTLSNTNLTSIVVKETFRWALQLKIFFVCLFLKSLD